MQNPKDEKENLADLIENAEIVDLTDVPIDDPRHPEYEPSEQEGDDN